jgi:hypothetical protein
MLGVLLVIVSVPLSAVYSTWSAQQAEKASWNIFGPPCPMAAPPSQSEAGRRPLKVFEYGGVSFARRFGHVSCVGLSEGGVFDPRSIYRVCQFSSPARLAVTTADKTVFYAPGVAQKATVTVRNGTPSCVLGGWFAP